MYLNRKIESIYYDSVRDQLGIYGWGYDYYGKDFTLTLYVNGKEWPCDIERRPVINLPMATIPNPGFLVSAPLHGEKLKTFELWGQCENNRERFLKKSALAMKRWTIDSPMIKSVDLLDLKRDNTLHIEGWCASTVGELPEIRIENEAGVPQEFDLKRIQRGDVGRYYGLRLNQTECGFHIRFPWPETGEYTVVFDDGQNVERYPISRKKIAHEEFLKKTGYRKTQVYLKQHGVIPTVKKIFLKVFHLDTVKYGAWYKRIKLSELQLQEQRETEFPINPKISFVVPLYKTPEEFLKDMIGSIREQTYANWELCLADGSGEGASLEALVAPYMAEDKRIRYQNLGKNLGIAGNSNAAIAMATGDYIALVDHDDMLPPECAFMLAEKINEDPEAEVIYTDEDKISAHGEKHKEPNFKSDFNIDMLRSVNYICHLFVMKKELLDRIGGFRQEFDGAQDYDLILRATEEANRVLHIPHILYHWRMNENSTAMDAESKLYAFEAGKRALDEHYKRVGLPAHVEHGEKYGMYHTIYEWGVEPKVSVLIPSKDHTDDLNTVIHSLEDVATYKNLEIIVIENNSTAPETWEYYEKIQKEYDNVRVVVCDTHGEFNYSLLNNFGEKYATGEYLLLLNNDVELINPDTIQELLGYALRPDVGAVGALLYYPDGTIRHAGVIFGLGSVAGHCFPGVAKGDPAYMGRNLFAQNYCAVTGACLMVKKSKFEEAGGLNEEGLKVAFNDVDFCMELRRCGYKNVYNPYATLYHYESKSRGAEDTPERQARFASEILYFRKKWAKELEEGDPYYNPNLTLDKNDFSLRI